MTNLIIGLFSLSIATTMLFAFLYWCERIERKALQKTLRDLNPFNRKMRVIPSPEMEIIQKNTALENENAGLRGDVQTGCRTINAQITTINELRRLLHASQARNKIQKAGK